MQGVNRSEIIQFNATNNNDISLIWSNKKYYTNLFSQTLFQDRNIIITDTDIVSINHCQFSNNIGIDGSCLKFQQINFNVTIQQSVFLNNIALANGGAIYISDSNNITIKKNTLFQNNTAQIGGAMRIQNTQQQIFIYKSSDTNSTKITLIYTGYMFEQNKNDLILQNIKSGVFSLNCFSFNNLQVTGFPLSQISTAYLSITISQWQQNIEIPFTLIFRNCIKGEVYEMISSNLVNCVSCKYINNYICKKCPEGSQSCFQDKILLQKGYWRETNNSDQIFQCNQINPEICDSNNQNGCIEGHIGPLCETCDFFGNVWQGKSYAQGSQVYECNACRDEILQLLLAILLIVVLLVYLLSSTLIFIRQYVYNSTLTYIRILKILPYSNSCLLDQSTFIIKTLINYLQVSSILVNIDYKLIYSAINIGSQFVGQPISSIAVNSQCFYKYLGYELYNYNELKIRSLLFFLFLTQLYSLLCKYLSLQINWQQFLCCNEFNHKLQ
ncbi:transmembrane protein, putative (macronuclear) [Tetrahymena thermophila SB210]|uniref:Transmembrane protein, putative n=1 Tax=Tetrahymena thermophila (strain SB210) TaxID=312017 RepID=W7XGS1_TETTS|nr:transmembrane protein, putative [Tetrahymena thermophila SB210]EWS72169.1 transmembrane protein, putative [Tetrahymena thermophila SB210]|eukprot:XP_012655300.1 transmembrane protein, putative [Tetrahymena thermophila SB210]